MPALRSVSLPEIGCDPGPPRLSRATYEARLDAAQHRARDAKHDVVVVYGDREHCSNLLYLTGFDPRFEEGILILRPGGRRVLVVGTEGIDYARVAGPDVEVVLCQAFSLLGQPRSEAPSLATVLREVGLRPGDDVGLVGWKYFGDAERSGVSRFFAVPHFVVQAIDGAVGARGTIREATPLLLDPFDGLQTANEPAQLAFFEYGASLASQYVLRVLRRFEPGMTELEAAREMGMNGFPLACHPMVISGRDDFVSLRSPTSRTIDPGDTLLIAAAAWGGLTARAGVVAASGVDPEIDEFARHFAGAYYAAIKTWYETVRVGVSGEEVVARVSETLRDAPFRLLLNPGHLTGFEEWLHSPMEQGSSNLLKSGMMLQCDLIPSGGTPGRTCNVEDTVCLADEGLRRDLYSAYPQLAARVELRRAFLREELGIEPSDDLVPFSNMPGFFPVLMLDRNTSLSFAQRGVA